MRTFLILFLIASSSIANAKSQSSLDQFWEHYISSYTTYLNTEVEPDITPIIAHFNEPSMQVPPRGKPRVSPTHEELGKGFTGFLARLKRKGVAKMEWERIQVVRLSDTTAIASNIARALDKDGNVVDRRSSIYSLYRSEDGWKIAMIQSHDPKNVPTLK